MIIRGKEKIYMNDNYDRIFIDTNILVYAHDKSAGYKNKISQELITYFWNNKKGFISTQVLQEFYVTITKKVKNPLKKDIASLLISDLGRWYVYRPDANDIIEAINIQKKYDLSFWDSLIICSAIKSNCDAIMSEDLNNGQKYEEILVVNPFLTK